MPLFSPSLHGIAGMPTVTGPDGGADKIAFADVSLSRAAKVKLAKHAQTECFIFGTSGLTTDSPSSANFTVSVTVPRIQIIWPFNWTCTGIRTSVSGRPAAGAAAGINILRGNNSIFDDVTGNTTAYCTIATGAGNLYSSLVSPHANHASWSKGDDIKIYNVAGANGSGNQSNNFHALKVMLFGYRR